MRLQYRELPLGKSGGKTLSPFIRGYQHICHLSCQSDKSVWMLMDV